MQQIVARRNWVRLGLVGVWGVVAIAGLIAVYAHAFKNEDIGRAEVIWPSDSSLEQSPDRCTLVMFAHPRCPCTLASLDSLARVMGVADCKAVVVFWQPDSDSQPVESSSWRNSPSIKLAEKMQDVSIYFDRSGAEFKKFGVNTSGHCMAFSKGGVQLFTGGLTSSRGHVGPSAASDSLIQSIQSVKPTKPSPVYGCTIRQSSCHQATIR
jgi:hypothetical protein